MTTTPLRDRLDFFEESTRVTEAKKNTKSVKDADAAF